MDTFTERQRECYVENKERDWKIIKVIDELLISLKYVSDGLWTLSLPEGRTSSITVFFYVDKRQ